MYLLKGIIKSMTGIELIYQFNESTGGTINARYCYSIWLRHLLFAYHNAFNLFQAQRDIMQLML